MSTSLDFDRYDRIRPIRWTGDALELLDQRKLPFVVEYVSCTDSDAVAAAIHALTVRGAPAIGIAAAWGVVLASRAVEAGDGKDAAAKLEPAMQKLNAARPTAVNLAWALARMRRVLVAAGADWRALAWWIHDRLPYSRLQFFPKLAAFNIQWHERPQRRIDSFIPPKGCLTKPGMPDHAGDHSRWYRGFPEA